MLYPPILLVVRTVEERRLLMIYFSIYFSHSVSVFLPNVHTHVVARMGTISLSICVPFFLHNKSQSIDTRVRRFWNSERESLQASKLFIDLLIYVLTDWLTYLFIYLYVGWLVGLFIYLFIYLFINIVSHTNTRMTQQTIYVNKWIIRHGQELVTYDRPPIETYGYN